MPTVPEQGPARNFLIHLRLPFQLLLAPFMLYGATLAHGALSLRFLAAFLIAHVCFYGGATAFNSHYDQDEGPIGGLEHPPPAGAWLLPGSLLLQGLGLGLAWLVSPAFAWVCGAFAILGVLYSHPSTRFKGQPWLSWLTVMLGQGVLGAYAGVVAVAGPSSAVLALPTPETPWGLAGAALVVGALYPLSQLFQMEEDRARGDRTVALALGRLGSKRAAALLFSTGCVLLAVAALRAGHAADAFLLLGALAPLLVGTVWVCQPRTPREVFHRVLRFQIAASAAFAAYALARLAG